MGMHVCDSDTPRLSDLGQGAQDRYNCYMSSTQRFAASHADSTVLSGHVDATGEWGRWLVVDSSSDILQYFQCTASQLSDVTVVRIVDKPP